MAFASSSSAFGIKPATQPSTSIFGQGNTYNNQTSLLGGASQPSTNTFGTFGSQPQTQNQNGNQTTSLFGTPLGQNPNQQQQSQTPQGSSLFGPHFGQTQSQQQQPQQAPSTGLFGQSNANAQQQAPSTNFFSQTGQKSTLGPSLFSNTQTGQSNQPQQSTFGALGTNTNSTSTLGQSTGLGGWGASASNTLQTQPTQSAGAFGQSTLGSTTAGSLFGRPQHPSFGANQSSGPAPFTKSMKFNDLPEDIKKMFENIDLHIQGRVQISSDLKQRKLGEEAIKGQEGVRGVHKDLVNAITTLHSDVLHMRDLKAKVDQTVQDTITATRIVDGFRNPQQHGTNLKNHANFPLEFFYRMTEQMRERLRWYKTTIEQIERKLSSAAAQSQYTPQTISSTLEAQHTTFMSLASKTAALDAELQKIKALYTQLWRAKTGSMRDPFYELDRGSVGEFGLESLNTK